MKTNRVVKVRRSRLRVQTHVQALHRLHVHLNTQFVMKHDCREPRSLHVFTVPSAETSPFFIHTLKTVVLFNAALLF